MRWLAAKKLAAGLIADEFRISNLNLAADGDCFCAAGDGKAFEG